MEKKYHPINCNYYDELVLLVMRKKHCEIIYLNEANEQITELAMITDVFTKEKAEYIKLSNNQIIRLDRLISADGKENKLSCS